MELPKPNIPEIINEPSTYAACEYVAALAHDRALVKVDPFYLDNLGATFDRVEFSNNSGHGRRSKLIIRKAVQNGPTSYDVLLAEVANSHAKIPEITKEEFSVTPTSIWRKDALGDVAKRLDDVRARLLNESIIQAIHADKTIAVFSTPDNELPIEI